MTVTPFSAAPLRVTFPEIEWIEAASAGRVTVPTSNKAIAIICASIIPVLRFMVRTRIVATVVAVCARILLSQCWIDLQKVVVSVGAK